MNEYIPYTSAASEADHRFLNSKREGHACKNNADQDSFERLTEMLQVVHGRSKTFNRKGAQHAG